jgi:putative ABC transport system permease protein
VYPSLYQVPMSEVTFVVRGSIDANSLVRPAQEAIWSVDPELALYRVEAVETTLSRSLAPQRFRALLMLFFAGVSLLLASIGVYGLLAWQVSRRKREIGVRMALGAEPGGVMVMVLREGGGLTIAGVLLGIAAAIPASRFVSGLLYGVPPLDAPTYVVSSAVLLSAALVACAIPARRAARLDPVTALREE